MRPGGGGAEEQDLVCRAGVTLHRALYTPKGNKLGYKDSEQQNTFSEIKA